MLKKYFLLVTSCGICQTAWSQSPLYSDAKSILDSNCVTCHNPTGAADYLPFTSLELIKGNAQNMASAIRDDYMPYGKPPGFKSTPDGLLLLKWLETGADVNGPVAPPTAPLYGDVKPILDRHCVTCHKPNGAADHLPFTSLEQVKGNEQKMVSAIRADYMPYRKPPGFKSTPDGLLLLKWLETGADINGPVVPPAIEHILMRDPRTLTYEDVKPIINRNCVGCHNPNGRVPNRPFNAITGIRRYARFMVRELDRGDMPLGNAEFRFTADGRALLGWLRFGKDISEPAGGGEDDDAGVGQ